MIFIFKVYFNPNVQKTQHKINTSLCTFYAFLTFLIIFYSMQTSQYKKDEVFTPSWNLHYIVRPVF